MKYNFPTRFFKFCLFSILMLYRNEGTAYVFGPVAVPCDCEKEKNNFFPKRRCFSFKNHTKITWPIFAVPLIDLLIDRHVVEALVCNWFSYEIDAANQAHFQILCAVVVMAVMAIHICNFWKQNFITDFVRPQECNELTALEALEIDSFDYCNHTNFYVTSTEIVPDCTWNMLDSK